jgi:hypothetical protein
MSRQSPIFKTLKTGSNALRFGRKATKAKTWVKYSKHPAIVSAVMLITLEVLSGVALFRYGLSIFWMVVSMLIWVPWAIGSLIGTMIMFFPLADAYEAKGYSRTIPNCIGTLFGLMFLITVVIGSAFLFFDVNLNSLWIICLFIILWMVTTIVAGFLLFSKCTCILASDSPSEMKSVIEQA